MRLDVFKLFQERESSKKIFELLNKVTWMSIQGNEMEKFFEITNRMLNDEPSTKNTVHLPDKNNINIRIASTW